MLSLPESKVAMVICMRLLECEGRVVSGRTFLSSMFFGVVDHEVRE